jgi:hypothetical protein
MTWSEIAVALFAILMRKIRTAAARQRIKAARALVTAAVLGTRAFPSCGTHEWYSRAQKRVTRVHELLRKAMNFMDEAEVQLTRPAIRTDPFT